MQKPTFLIAACGLTAACCAQTLLNSQLVYTTYETGLSSPAAFEFMSDSTMIVIEKNSGKAKVITNGVYTGDAIDLNVANEGEMGLLGIVKDPNFASNNFVYLFYSTASTDGGAWIDDRLVRYTWNGTTLGSPVNLWIMGPTAQFPETQIYHHGGYIKIGPDDKLYLQRGDMLRWGSIEMNYQNPSLVGMCGSIYRLNLDGSAPSDNPFFSHANETIKKIWVYGFRNGYGMSWDRSTGDLWFSENGPTVYDEVNIASPGMNSGWRLIMGPDARNAAYPNNNNQAWNAKDLYYFPGAQYRDPVFSYLNPVGLSGLEFFSSTRFLESSTVFDNVLMGCTNTQQIYMLPVAANRMGVNGTGALADLVADNASERDLWAIGNGWGIITDARIGPEGYMYVADWLNGRIQRIRPKADAVFPFDIDLVRGIITGGNVSTSLEYPDDS
jgi:glucose/arabinose dehydrogenase